MCDYFTECRLPKPGVCKKFLLVLVTKSLIEADVLKFFKLQYKFTVKDGMKILK